MSHIIEIIAKYINQGGCVILPLMGISVWMWYLIAKKIYIICQWKKYQTAYLSDAGIMAEFKARRIFDDQMDCQLINSLIKKEQNKLNAHIQTIFVLAALSPLLGLLGTVSGMIETFDVIARFGTANSKALAGGISQALITTQAGLIVAVPGLVMGHIIQQRTGYIQNYLSCFSAKIKNQISQETGYETGIPAAEK